MPVYIRRHLTHHPSLRSIAVLALLFSSNPVSSSFHLEATRTLRTTTSTAHTRRHLHVFQSPSNKDNIVTTSYSIRGGSTSVAATSENTSIMSTIPTAGQRLQSLRSLMKELNLDCYIVPSDDPHLSEYVPLAYMRRKFMSDFKGSAGVAVVLQDEALLWTDSRYHNEASLQLDANHWTLMKQGLPQVPSYTKYLADKAVEKYSKSEQLFRVGIDAFVHAASFEKELKDAFKNAVGSSDLDEDTVVGEIDTLDERGNLVDEIWESRPPIPRNPFRVHPLEYAGKSVSDKVKDIRKVMKEKKATLSVFSALDDIAYLFNVRAKGDVDTCPVGISYATISHDEVSLFCHDEKVAAEEVQVHLKEAGVTIKPYDTIIDEIKNHLQSVTKAKIWMDKTRSNLALSRVIPEQSILDEMNAVVPVKACKNSAEMEGMRLAHIRDGVAMAHFIAWLQHALKVEKNSVSEVEIDKVLTGFRAEQPGFVEVSFPTIAGVGSNGAIIHYRAEDDSDLLKQLDLSNPILIDSGGQYTYGTTDVTRTWHFGEATPQFKEIFTRVLKGNIGVDSMIFPTNTPGFVLDVFARKSLWEAGLDYGHGTGHGVGAALNVHEGPHSISPRWGNKEAMKKGMVVSNEPGYYEDGNFGIRIENLLETTYVNEEDNQAYDQGISDGDEGFPEKPAGKKTFLKFNKLTMIPIQKELIVVSLMTASELDWLDAYHEEIWNKISPLLKDGCPGKAWLQEACSPIRRC